MNNSVFTDNEYIDQLKEEVEKALILAELPQDKIDKNLDLLDLFILGRVSENLFEYLTDEQKAKLKELVDKGTASEGELIAALGVNKEQILELYIQELEDYLVELIRNIPNLAKKQQLSK